MNLQRARPANHRETAENASCRSRMTLVQQSGTQRSDEHRVVLARPECTEAMARLLQGAELLQHGPRQRLTPSLKRPQYGRWPVASGAPGRRCTRVERAAPVGRTYRGALSGRFVTTARRKRSPTTTIKDN